MSTATVPKPPKNKSGPEETPAPTPRSDFFVRLSEEQAARLARYKAKQKVKVQEQDVIRAALDEFLDRELGE